LEEKIRKTFLLDQEARGFGEKGQKETFLDWLGLIPFSRSFGKLAFLLGSTNSSGPKAFKRPIYLFGKRCRYGCKRWKGYYR